MNNHVQAILRMLAVLVAVCAASCDKQATKSEAAASSKKTNPTKATSPANLKHVEGGAQSTDVRAALKQVANTRIMWTDGNAVAAKRQLSELVNLHKSLSESPAYENAIVSADCELKLCNSIVPALINGHLSPAETRSLIASIAANRFTKSSLATMLNQSAPDSPQARTLAVELNSGRPVNLIEASNALLKEQGANLLDGPTPNRLVELLEKPNAARAFQYHAMMAAKLDVAEVIAEFAFVGGDLQAENETLAVKLQEKLPHLINAPGKLTNRPMNVRLIADFLRDWRNGSFAK
jgi:hypothetical protein